MLSPAGARFAARAAVVVMAAIIAIIGILGPGGVVLAVLTGLIVTAGIVTARVVGFNLRAAFK